MLAKIIDISMETLSIIWANEKIVQGKSSYVIGYYNWYYKVLYVNETLYVNWVNKKIVQRCDWLLQYVLQSSNLRIRMF